MATSRTKSSSRARRAAHAPTRAEPAPPVAAAATGDRDPSLEAAILAAPDERAPLLVYADWLQARQQPLGEVIALAIAAEDEPPRQRKLKVNATRALTAYVEQHLDAATGILIDLVTVGTGSDPDIVFSLRATGLHP